MKTLGLAAVLLAAASVTGTTGALAFEDEAIPPGGGAASTQEPESAPPAAAGKKSRRNLIPAQKDAEGTEAPNRFHADTVIKSTYKLEGKTLEVDPD